VNFLYDYIEHTLQNIIDMVHKCGHAQIDAVGTHGIPNSVK